MITQKKMTPASSETKAKRNNFHKELYSKPDCLSKQIARLKRTIVEYIEQQAHEIPSYEPLCGAVTFAELSQEIPDFNGKYALCAEPENRNIILWTNMSAAAVKAMQTLFREGRLIAKHCTKVAYWYDGKVLRMRTANLRYKGNYKRLRWLPILVCLPSHDANADGYTEVSPDLLGRK